MVFFLSTLFYDKISEKRLYLTGISAWSASGFWDSQCESAAFFAGLYETDGIAAGGVPGADYWG